MTASQAILAALHNAATAPGQWFREPDVIVIVWRAFPERFGMRGHPQFADSKAVSAYLCVRKPFRTKYVTGKTYLAKPKSLVGTYLDRVKGADGITCYRLTAAGVAAAKIIPRAA